EIASELSYELTRTEPAVALLSAGHELATKTSIPLDALADEEFIIFPRDLGPRLHDFIVALCRNAGFEPKQRNESLHARLTLGTLDASSVGLVPQSASQSVPPGIVAVPVAGSGGDPFETYAVWRTDDDRAVVSNFVDCARTVFAS